MKNGNTPANPINTFKKNGELAVSTNEFQGLTKREMFAMHAMQAILANGASEEIGYTDWSKHLAKHAITAADALLKELES